MGLQSWVYSFGGNSCFRILISPIETFRLAKYSLEYHGSGILFSGIYPGFIFDTEIMEKSGAILYVENEHKTRSDPYKSFRQINAAKKKKA